jgi:hypothetical protein
MLTAMTYSAETMKKMGSAIESATTALLGVGAASEGAVRAMDDLPRFEDTCCGNCGQGLCYVDGVTGA